MLTKRICISRLLSKNLIVFTEVIWERAKQELSKESSQKPIWVIFSILGPLGRVAKMNTEFDNWNCAGSIFSVPSFILVVITISQCWKGQKKIKKGILVIFDFLASWFDRWKILKFWVPQLQGNMCQASSCQAWSLVIHRPWQRKFSLMANFPLWLGTIESGLLFIQKLFRVLECLKESTVFCYIMEL